MDLSRDLLPDEVHVWQAALDVGSARLADLSALLSEDELRRAARFHFPLDRDRWIAAHGLLRVILGRYVATAPAALRFELGTYGKPKLIDEVLGFNLSHSGDQALIAVTKQGEVGVDIERLRSDFSPEEMAANVFSPQERADLHSLPSDIRHHAFLTLWTGKEAYVKARGDGLSFPLSQLTLRLDPQTRTFQVEDATEDGSRPPLSLCQILDSEKFVAALAVEGSLTAICLLASGIL